MTVAIAARCEGGVVCATDSAISVGDNRITLPGIKGELVHEGFAMYAGVLADAQSVLRGCSEQTVLETVLEEYDDWEETDGADFLIVSYLDQHIYTVDSSGAYIPHSDYGAIGHGSDLARFGLMMNYKAGRTAAYVESMLKTIIKSIEMFDRTCYGPVRSRFIPSNA